MNKKMSELKKIERGDLIFFYPVNIFEKIIAYFDGRYCHCGIYLGDGLVLSMTRQGLRIEKILVSRKYDAFSIDTDKQEELIKFLLSQFSVAKYDFLGILNFIFSFINERPSRFYCSEFLTLGLFYIGLLPERLQLSPLQLSNQEFLKKK